MLSGKLDSEQNSFRSYHHFLFLSRPEYQTIADWILGLGP